MRSRSNVSRRSDARRPTPPKDCGRRRRVLNGVANGMSGVGAATKTPIGQARPCPMAISPPRVGDCNARGAGHCSPSRKVGARHKPRAHDARARRSHAPMYAPRVGCLWHCAATRATLTFCASFCRPALSPLCPSTSRPRHRGRTIPHSRACCNTRRPETLTPWENVCAPLLANPPTHPTILRLTAVWVRCWVCPGGQRKRICVDRRIRGLR